MKRPAPRRTGARASPYAHTMAVQDSPRRRQHDDDEMAREIVAFLVNKSPYGGPSELTKYVTQELRQIAENVAKEYVQASPELHELIRRYTRDIIEEIVADDGDGYLRKAVSNAVGETLAMRREILHAERENDDN